MTSDLAALPEVLDSSELQRFDAGSLPAPKNIDIGFFLHKTRKSTKLIGNQSSENFIKARRDWMDFDFIDIIYVKSIVVFADGYESYHELELSYEDFISKQTTIQRVKYESGCFTFLIERFLGGFGLRPNESWFKSSRLTSIKIDGVEQSSFSEVIDALNDIESYKTKTETHLNRYLERAASAEKRSAELAEFNGELEQSIRQHEERLADLEDAVEGEGGKLEDVKKQVAIAESVKRNIDEQVQISTNNVGKLKQTSEILSSEVSEKELRLRSLENDINLFPTEIAGYVSQGALNVKLYSWLCLIPSLVVIFVTIRLFLNSEKLLGLDNLAGMKIFDFIVSRLPYVIVSAVILAICYSVLHRLITEIIGINRRRQDLFKVSIIATDISYASQTNLDMPSEEIYNLRTQTKMELLKEHLRQHIGEEFVYNPKSSIFHKLSNKIAGSIASDEVDAEKKGGQA